MKTQQSTDTLHLMEMQKLTNKLNSQLPKEFVCKMQYLKTELLTNQRKAYLLFNILP